ncbi:hypothetical protein DSECCO2_363030 [anaerobic digester metagenome]
MIPTTPNTILGTAEVIKPVDMPSRTYRIDYTACRVTGMVDGQKAMAQAVRKVLQTDRFAHLIYSWNYGMEWNRLIGQSMTTVESDMKRLLEEALLQDARILSISEFSISQKGKRIAAVTVTVNTIFGEVSEEVQTDV